MAERSKIASHVSLAVGAGCWLLAENLTGAFGRGLSLPPPGLPAWLLELPYNMVAGFQEGASQEVKDEAADFAKPIVKSYMPSLLLQCLNQNKGLAQFQRERKWTLF